MGIEPNPDAYEHARLRYPRVAFRRDIAETFIEPCDAVVFLQTIEHVADPGAVLDHIRSQLRPGGVAYVSTPNVLTLAPEGADRVDNPGTSANIAPRSSARCARRTSGASSCSGVFHARMLRAHEVALRPGWDRVHKGAADHEAVLRPVRPGDRGAGLRAAPPAAGAVAGSRGRVALTHPNG